MTEPEIQEQRSSFRSLLFGASAVVLTVLVLAGYDGSRDLARLRGRQQELAARLRQTDSRIAELGDRIERLRSDPYTLERVAREELGLSRPGEVVVILPARHDRQAVGSTSSQP